MGAGCEERGCCYGPAPREARRWHRSCCSGAESPRCGASAMRSVPPDAGGSFWGQPSPDFAVSIEAKRPCPSCCLSAGTARGAVLSGPLASAPPALCGAVIQHGSTTSAGHQVLQQGQHPWKGRVQDLTTMKDTRASPSDVWCGLPPATARDLADRSRVWAPRPLLVASWGSKNFHLKFWLCKKNKNKNCLKTKSVCFYLYGCNEVGGQDIQSLPWFEEHPTSNRPFT